MTVGRELSSNLIWRFSRLFSGRLTLLVVAAVLGLALMVTEGPTVFAAASETNFDFETVILSNIDDVVAITVATVEVDAGVDAFQVNVQHPPTLEVSNPACGAIFGSRPGVNLIPNIRALEDGTGTLIGCNIFDQGVDVVDTTGDVMTFDLKRIGDFTENQIVTMGASLPATAFTDNGVVISAGTTNQIVVQATPPDGNTDPVASWSFEEGEGTTANDASGNGNTGTLENGTARVPGKVGSNGVGFGGSSGLVRVPDNDLLDFGAGQDFSISFWLRDSTPGLDETGAPELLEKQGDAGGFYQIRSPNSTGDLRVQISDGTNQDVFNTTAGNLANGQWHHVVVIRDAGVGISAYVDGNLAGSDNTPSAGNLANSAPLLFGAGNTSGATYDGALDQVKIYRQVLSAAEIAQLFAEGSVTAPVADAGEPQNVEVGETVTLDGSGSTNALTYSWALTTRPTNSTASLTGAETVSPRFVADLDGTYVAELVVNNGTEDSEPASVTITAGNTKPVAVAGEDQEVAIGATVTLTGSGSTDADGDSLTYRWTLIDPNGSNATTSLTGAETASPRFVADLDGEYVAELVVNDGTVNSEAATVSIVATDGNRAPVAVAAQNVAIGAKVTLDGSGSTDADGDSLTYRWTLTTRPINSTASLTGADTASPSFVVDLKGEYVAKLVVNDGTVNSGAATVRIVATDDNRAPVAVAGEDQEVAIGATVTLDGSGSTDADGDSLTYRWTLTTRPINSTASLTGADTASPRFVADLEGTYVAVLVVNNGTVNSEPASVTITAGVEPPKPVANAGEPQNVEVGETVTLDGSASTGAETYRWTLTTRPINSTASLTGADTASPRFVADLKGTYLATLVVNDGTVNSEPASVRITAGKEDFDMVIGLPDPGKFAVVSAPTLLSQVPTIEQDDPAGSSLIMVYANNQFLIFGEPGFGEEVIKPVTAFYITASSNATVGFNFAQISGPSQTSKSLDAGWNLIGTNFPGPVQDELSQIQNTQTTAGIITLHVPNAANSNKDLGHEDWEEDGDRDLNANPITALPDRNLSDRDGYWAFLDGPRTYTKLLTATP